MSNEVNKREMIRDKYGSTDWATDPESSLKSVMDALAEEVLHISDEELLAEVAEEGLDPAEEAEEVRRILLVAVREAHRDKSSPVSPPPAATGQ